MPHMRTLLTGHKRIWLVYSHDWYTDPNQLIPSELRQQLHQTEQNAFIGLQVLRFDTK